MGKKMEQTGKIRIIKKNALNVSQTAKEKTAPKEKRKGFSIVSAWVEEFKTRRSENVPSFADIFVQT